MSDNTPTDGTKNSETDAALASNLDAAAQPAGENRGGPDHAAANPAPVVEPELAPEPIVIDYDAMNANLTAAEPDDPTASSPHFDSAVPRETSVPLTATGSGEAPGADADAPSLAADYADDVTVSTSSSQAAGSRNDTTDPQPVPTADPLQVVEPVTVAEPVALIVTAPAAAGTPIDYSASAPAGGPVGAAAPTLTPGAQGPIYVQAPTKPKTRSNRGGGILIALLATVVFAVLYAVAAFIIIGVTSTTIAVTVNGFAAFAGLPVFYIPIVFFFLAYSALISLINRGGWWAHVLFGFLVAVVVYFSYIGGALLGLVIDGRADGIGSVELGRIVSTLWLNPGAIAAGLVAREVPIWAGAWIARRGRRVTARNLEARVEYDRLLADGPQVTRP